MRFYPQKLIASKKPNVKSFLPIPCYPLRWEKRVLQWLPRRLSSRDTAGIEPKIPETKEDLPFDEMVAEDVLHLALDRKAPAGMQSLMFAIIHNNLHLN